MASDRLRQGLRRPFEGPNRGPTVNRKKGATTRKCPPPKKCQKPRFWKKICHNIAILTAKWAQNPKGLNNKPRSSRLYTLEIQIFLWKSRSIPENRALRYIKYEAQCGVKAPKVFGPNLAPGVLWRPKADFWEGVRGGAPHDECHWVGGEADPPVWALL